jgi:hypothetical protein
VIEDCSNRYYLEKILPLPIGAREGEILLYSTPDPEKLYKAFKTKVVVYNKLIGKQVVSNFEEIGNLSSEFEKPYPSFLIKRAKLFVEALKNNYENLYRASLYIAPCLKDKLSKIQKVLQVATRSELELEGIKPEYVDDQLTEIEKELSNPQRSYSTFKEIWEIFNKHYSSAQN